ncbi:DUF3231 family protein [Pullulanibacillus sp. KACC 23026]|uniref:DUF3231 family protein n=1 Tax=Pullulanibacillus sp. KACC 23026 TaxID=3028315 RepID=UPI0023AF259E|nr:DUF3231 family protein [Pullulanibacillus sp. KACC 23026]WEG12232.1 DUF3231 family protein [Pullulanibacillus sp. KACC 23026]
MDDTNLSDLNHHTKLTSSEMATLWTTMLADSSMIAFLTHFAEHKEDEDVNLFVRKALDTAIDHRDSVAAILENEGITRPIGFPLDKHVNLKAPRLFTDVFYCHYILQACKAALLNHNNSFTASSRKDVVTLFQRFYSDTSTLVIEMTNMMQGKGIYIRPPYIPYQEKSDGPIKKNSFLGGWFGAKRPLLANELGQLFDNSYSNQMGRVLLNGFIQVIKDKEIQEYFIRGRKLATKFVHRVQQMLEDELAPHGMIWDSQVTTSTESPFSDQLMLYLVGSLNSVGLGKLGLSLAQTLRRDVASFYMSSFTLTTAYSEDGLNLLIDRQWMEEPPQCPDRKEIASQSKL